MNGLKLDKWHITKLFSISEFKLTRDFVFILIVEIYINPSRPNFEIINIP